MGITRLMLTGFRSYRAASLSVESGSVVLLGENGAGKTNLIEAISLLGPGRGLRGAALPELARQVPGEGGPGEESRGAWAVAATLDLPRGTADLGTGIQPEMPGEAARRIGRRDGQTVGLTSLAEDIRLVWLTPAMDRLFVESASGRRKFLDRLVLALDPPHAARSTAFERAMRERNRLLRDGPRDPLWLDGLEGEMARHGTLIALARVRLLAQLEAALSMPGPFPHAVLALDGVLEERLAAGETAEAVAEAYAAGLAQSRPRDEAAGRTLKGPHMSDLRVTYRESGRAAAQCSTGEQKALLIGLVLAQARLVAEEAPEACPILLLDEIGAHLDERRRALLFDVLSASGVQAWLTGTDAAAFTDFGARAQRLHIAAGRVAPL